MGEEEEGEKEEEEEEEEEEEKEDKDKEEDEAPAKIEVLATSSCLMLMYRRIIDVAARQGITASLYISPLPPLPPPAPPPVHQGRPLSILTRHSSCRSVNVASIHHSLSSVACLGVDRGPNIHYPPLKPLISALQGPNSQGFAPP